jgi:glutamate carboxypeptidase
MDRSLNDKIVAYVRGHAEAQLSFVIDLCNENSYTYNIQGTNRVTEMILAQLEGFFPQREVREQAEVGSHHILRTRAACEPPGRRSIYLLGHMDTVFPPYHPFQRCRREGDWLIGPGTGDMKGGLGVIVYALKALENVGLLDRLDLSLILSGDEEIGSATSHSLYEVERERARLCLVAECAGPEGEIVVSRNGKAGARLDCFGVDSHVARVSGGKASAIVEMAHKVIALEALNGSQPGVTINAGRIEGGLGPSTVPAHASCLFDMRWSDEKDYGALLSETRRIVQESVQPQCRCEYAILNHRPAMPASEVTEKMFRELRQLAESLGISLRAEHRRGTSDANYFGAAGVPTLDGFGPICEGDHTSSERILISSLRTRTTLLALSLCCLGSGHPG